MLVAGELLAPELVVRVFLEENVVPIDLSNLGSVIVFELRLVDELVLWRFLFPLLLQVSFVGFGFPPGAFAAARCNPPLVARA